MTGDGPPMNAMIGLVYTGDTKADLLPYGFAVTNTHAIIATSPWTGPPMEDTSAGQLAHTHRILECPQVWLVNREERAQLLNNFQIRIVVGDARLLCPMEVVPRKLVLSVLQYLRDCWPEWDAHMTTLGIPIITLSKWD